MMSAVLSNPNHPEYGVATIPFPIPHDQYTYCMELLKALEIGDAVKADCKVVAVDSFSSVLKRTEMLTVNVEELNYLAKRLESFDTGEAAQFQAMAHKLELFELKDLINLTFCCQQATVITDFSDLAAVGRDHYMNLHGGSASVDELNALDGEKTARRLIENGGGTITCDASYGSGADGQLIVACYSIADTGVGMSEEFAQHIFDEFSQAENSASTKYKGTGLGMAITKRYVDLMGGTIRVESKKGKGSTFIVELPIELTDAEHVQKQAAPIETAKLTGVKILLAEDNDLNAEIATIQLEECGMLVTRAANGKEAVEVFTNHPAGTFDIILMDVMMPEMNGYEATKAIRSLDDRPDGHMIPIIAMTANAFAEDVQASLDAGMNGHLSKPIVMDELVKTIARNLNR